MKVVAWDSETALIRPAQLAPALVCVTWQEAGKPAGIEHHSLVEPRLRAWLEDPEVLFVLHNAAYDFAVVAERFPHLRDLIFKAYAENRVTDTMIRQQLLDIAAGVYRGRVDAKGKRIVYRYALEDLAKRCAGIQLQKDAWRTSYEAFIDVPLEKWPERALEVQAKGRERLAEVDKELAALPKSEKAIAKALQKEREGLVEMINGDPSRCTQYAIDDARATFDVWKAQEVHAAKYLKDQFRQTRAAFGLYLSSAWGICVDSDGARLLREQIEAEKAELDDELLLAGLIREDGTQDMKACKALMIQVCREEGLPIIRTDAHFEEELTWEERQAKGLKPRCKKADGTPLDDGSDECEEHVCLDADACERTGHPLIIAIGDWKTTNKQLSNDIPALERGAVYPLHTRYGLAATGRSTSCIARGTPVQMPCDRSKYPSGKPIEDVRAGDRVYSYSADGQLHLQRVLWAGRTGYKPVVKILWKGSGHRHSGELRLTADHRVMTLEGRWVEAQNLKPGMRLTALSCRPRSTGYYHLYARGGRDVKEHFFAYGKLNRRTQAVHHKDHNKANNELSNLEGMTQREHAALHASEWSDEERQRRADIVRRPEVQAAARAAALRGQEHPFWKDVPRSTLLRWAAESKGHIRNAMSLTGSDFEVLQRKFEAAGIDLMQVRKRYDPDGRYLSKRIVREAAQMPSTRQRHKHLKVGYYHCLELLDFYGLSGNHEVVAVLPAGFDHVYDLEVEHTHSFVAGEICVHNSKPNIQNQSNRPGFREAFVARPGYVFVQNDYPTLELYTLAQCCITWFGHSKLAEALRMGDPHLWVASIILNKPLDWCIAHKKDPDVVEARKRAKPGNFGFPGGMGTPKFVTTTRKSTVKAEGRAAWESLGLDSGTYTDEKGRQRYPVAEQLKEQWQTAFPEMQEHFARIRELTDTDDGLAMVETLFTGRWRGKATYCATANNGFQALGADCAKNAVWKVAEAQYTKRFSPLWNTRTVAFVHDELILECKDDGRAHDVAFELARVMTDAANEFLPDIPIPLEKMQPTVMYRWSKKAGQVFDDNGRLIAWVA